jgi:serine/threonine-protein kinase
VPHADHPAVRYSLESLARRLRETPTGDEASLTSASVGDTLAPHEPTRDIPPAAVVEAPLSPLTGDDTTISPAQRDTDTGATPACDSDPAATGIFDSTARQSAPRSEEFDLSATLAHRSSISPEQGGIPDNFDEYEIIEELGRGGMGVVYKAREKNTQRLVCLKMMLGGEYASPEALRRFQVETEAAAHLDHPNIVPIYRAGVVNGIPYFAMKYVAGKAMDAIDREEFKADPRRCVELVAKICRAVAFAHSRGILHRDLKPANILLDRDDEPHVTDFGLAKRMDDDSGQTRTGLIMGTPDYMSPEQAVGNNALVTVTSDVYSLGSILFDLLTGQPPFKSATIVETLTRVTREPARIPTTLHRQVDRDLETICLKCLEKDPGKRYRSAASLADELERFLRSEPIEGRPVGSAERCWRWCRRNPGLASLSAA